MKVLAVDPGGVTGLAWCDVMVMTTMMLQDDRFANHVELGQIDGSIAEQAAKIFRGIERLDVKVIVVEQSDHALLRPKKAGEHYNKNALVPVRICGALELVAMSKGLVHVEQTAGTAKGAMTDERMRNLGFEWKYKERHQIDAARHLCILLRRYKSSAQAGTPGGFHTAIDEGMRG